MVRATTALLGFGFSDIRIAYAGEGQRDLIGSTVAEIAGKRGVSKLAAYLDICEKSDFKARVLMGSYQNEAIVRRLMESGQSLFMTDAWVEESGKQNGAIYGVFPRFFRIAREMGWPVEKDRRADDGSAARRFGLEQRGLIREGYFADLNVIDMANFKDQHRRRITPDGSSVCICKRQNCPRGRRINRRTRNRGPGRARRRLKSYPIREALNKALHMSFSVFSRPASSSSVAYTLRYKLLPLSSGSEKSASKSIRNI